MKLSDITAKTKLVTDFSKRMAKTAKQKIVVTTVEKTKRVSGASARPVDMVFENGQSVKIYLRLAGGDDDDKLDIFRIDINGKAQPLSGDYDNSYMPSFEASVDMLANTIKNGQTAFDSKRAKAKVRKPRTGKAPMNKAQQRNALIEEAKELDVVIDSRTKEKAELETQLQTITSQP